MSEEIKLEGDRVLCTCEYFNETGLPCCHSLALIHHTKKIEVKHLQIKERWKKSFYIEKEELQEPAELFDSEDLSQNLKVPIKKPPKKRKRNKSVQEKGNQQVKTLEKNEAEKEIQKSSSSIKVSLGKKN